MYAWKYISAGKYDIMNRTASI